MPLAEEMMNLRREIDGLHAARKAMVHRLDRFRAELRKTMARRMANLHNAFDRECARARAARHAFTAHNQDMVSHMLAGFSAERAAARRNFRGKRA
jgi:di/tripeptidase